MRRPLKSGARALFAGLLVVIAAASASACQVALRAEDEDAQCPEDGKPCGNGLTCQGGVCRPCAPSPEICDQKDNDCDGQVDEDFDKDGDGFKECGVAGQIDCNDDPARGGKDIFPGQKELCNGYDDNCNALTDENTEDCTAEEECWSTKGRCTIKGDCRLHGCDMGGCNPDTGQCTEPDCRISNKCPEGTTCDPRSGICLKVNDLGEACDTTSVCKPGSSCINLTELGIPARSGAICTVACCESPSCPTGFVCRAGATGASVCVRASEVGGLVPGTVLANGKCTADSDCRSAQCLSGLCVDGCCASQACGTGGTCSLKVDNKFLCRSPVGTRSYGQSCSGDSECATGICWPGLFSGTCTKQCCTSEDCSSNWRCNTYIDSGNVYSVCAPLAWNEDSGSQRAGDTCSGNADCRSGRCVDKICSDSCCRSSDCAAGTLCQPKKLSAGAIPNRCVKPAP